MQNEIEMEVLFMVILKARDILSLLKKAFPFLLQPAFFQSHWIWIEEQNVHSWVWLL